MRKKDWNSYFEEAPLADDDFMPDRLNFKSTFTCDEEKNTSGMLPSISLNTDIDDTKQHLLVSMTNVMVKYPELRLGQLLVNAMSLPQLCPEIYHIESPELFLVEDTLLAERLNLLLL